MSHGRDPRRWAWGRLPRRPVRWSVDLRDQWAIHARRVLTGLPVAMVGIALGVGVYVTTHSGAFTGDSVVPRPQGGARPFTSPLGLARRTNILFIGIDVTINERRQVVPVARADTLMLATFDPQHARVGVLSIPRDALTLIPGIGAEKINAAYAHGGPRLTVRAVEDLLGVPVHYYVKLGASSFAHIIDALGGIAIDVEKDMKYTDTWANLYIDLKKGRQTLSGEQATHYIRFRQDDEGDIGRIRRQQQVLLTIFKTLKSPGAILRAPQLLRAVSRNTQTNLSASEVLALGWFAARLGTGAIHTATVPGEAGPVYVIVNDAETRRVVAEMFLGVDTGTLASTAVEVLNGSGIPGLARQTAQRLERLGFRIVRIDTAPVPVSTTTIIDHAGRPEVARVLAELLGRTRITREAGDGADITIVVARDLVARSSVMVSSQAR